MTSRDSSSLKNRNEIVREYMYQIIGKATSNRVKNIYFPAIPVFPILSDGCPLEESEIEVFAKEHKLKFIHSYGNTAANLSL